MLPPPPASLRLGVYGLVTATALDLLLLFVAPSVPGNEDNDTLIVRLMLAVFVKLPLVATSILLAIFTYRGSNNARRALGIIYLIGFVVTAWRLSRTELSIDAWIVVGITLFVMQLVSVSLLFTRQSDLWFARSA